MLCILIVLYGDFVENIYFNTDPITSKYTHTVGLPKVDVLPSISIVH